MVTKTVSYQHCPFSAEEGFTGFNINLLNGKKKAALVSAIIISFCTLQKNLMGYKKLVKYKTEYCNESVKKIKSI